MQSLNLGILAHVDAGKTSLTERLLFAAGVIDQIGRVDDGNTQTDSLALERQRGITIKSAVVSFVVDDVAINLIDTPGHPDFIAEVERVLSVLDGAVLVVSAVEGVQAQTRVLMRTLKRLRIPTLLFVNKLDRRGADVEGVLQSLSDKLTPGTLAMGAAEGAGTKSPRFQRFGAGDTGFETALAEQLAEHDEAILGAFVEDATALSLHRLREALATQVARAQMHPVFLGSAVTGAGVPELMKGIRELLPVSRGEPDAEPAGCVFKIERGPAGEKVAYVRMFEGCIRARDRLCFGGEEQRKVTAIAAFDRGAAVACDAIVAGQIGKLWGLGDVQVGDLIGSPHMPSERQHFARPTLEAVIAPSRASDKGRLHAALAQLVEQDPLINLRQDDGRQEIFVSLYGEVQKEVIQETLAREFGLEVEFRETTTICIERPRGSGAAAEFIKKGGNPFLATVGLRVDPAPIDSGVTYRLEVELGSMPASLHHAVEETVYASLEQGLCGWEVTDCTVTMTHSGYWPRQSHAHGMFDKSMSSTAGDFRHLTPLVLMDALKRAGTTVSEPIHHFQLEVPTETLGGLQPLLARLRVLVQTSQSRGTVTVLEGEIPAASLHALQQRLPGMTSGEGVLESAFDSYQPVRGPNPTRPRTDHNPLNRKEYLLHVVRRV